MDNIFSLEGKTILVTGASSGIGRSIAIKCSQAGATVIANGRNEERLQETLGMLEGTSHSCVAADLTEFDKLSDIVKQLPQLDGVVLCAGINMTVPVQNIKFEKLDSVVKTNAMSSMQIVGLLAKQKKINKGGSIVLISSIAWRKPYFGNAIYSASKAALTSFAKVAAMEMASRGVRVNCVEPGLIPTSIVENSVFDEQQIAEFEKTMLLGLGKPEHIANGCVYLLSDAAEWVTGTSLIIDGGQTLL